MLKKWMLGVTLLSISLFSQASVLEIDYSVSAVDMVGIEVTAYFEGGSFDTQTWTALSATSGGVIASDWSLVLDGDSFGQNDGNIFYGVWDFSNLGSDLAIIGLTIDAAIADFYFDTTEGNDSNTVGTGSGRLFTSTDTDITDDVNGDIAGPSGFTDMYIEGAGDLYGTLNISGLLLVEKSTFSFMTDTDRVEVPEPSTLFSLVFGLLALTSLRKKYSGK